MKLTITYRFAALSTLVVALIFVLFNAFVYLEFLNVTIDNEKRIVASHVAEVVHRIAGLPEARAVADVRRIVPDAKQMVRLVNPSGTVLTSSDLTFVPSWIPQGLGSKQSLGQGVTLFEHGTDRILVASAVAHLQRGTVTVEWLENVESLDHSIAFVFYLLVTGSAGGLLLAAFASYFLARYSLQPIREMIETARAITPGDLSSRIDVPKRQDELTVLGTTFNAMLDRITMAFTRERQFVADASHELRTPLSVLEGYVHLLRRWGWDDSSVRDEAMVAIEEEVQHLRRVASQLLSLAAVTQHPASPEEETDVTEAATRVVHRFMPLYAAYAWVLDVDEGVVARISGLALDQVLRGLLDNACKYTPAGGTIGVSVKRDAARVVLRVWDTGPGIPDEDLPHVTERFYRVDKARSREHGGAGLGLAICKEIVEAVSGSLTVARQASGGTEVSLALQGESNERDVAKGGEAND